MRDKIRWAPKVRPIKILELYESDASGLIDQALIEAVGIALYSRCQSIICVSRAQLRCPRCGQIITVGWGRPGEDIIVCPVSGCGWQATCQQYHQSWSKRQLIGANALGLFEAYVAAYAQATQPRQKMLLIDQLIHGFHRDLKTQQLNRSVANNLIEGSHQQVITLLDRLTYGADSTPGMQARQRIWREQKDVMLRRRRGI